MLPMTLGTLDLGRQLITLLVLAIPIASVAWTVTHEEVFREPREWCLANSKTRPRLVERKFFYLLRVNIASAIT